MTDVKLAIPNPDLRALLSGEVIVAFVPAGTVTSGDVVRLIGAGPRPAHELKPAYRRWSTEALPDGTWSATIDTVTAAETLDPEAGNARHILTEVPDGQLVVLRVESAAGPVLSDDAFAARRASLEAALRS